MTEKSLQCPSQEVLLDYAYGEEMPQVTSHLAECEKCRGFVGRERRLNQLLDGYCETPSGLAEGISQACRDEMDEEEFLAPKPSIAALRRALFEYVLKVAALVAVIAGAFFYIGRQSAYLGGDAVAASTETPVSVDSLFIDEVAPRAVASIPKAPARAYTSPRLDTGVELSGKTADPSQGFSLRDSQAFVASQTQNPRQNVTMASSNGADSLRGQHGASLAKVHDEVTHVWLADELPSPERIQSFLDKNNGNASGNATPDENGVISITFIGTDAGVQTIADTLYGEKHWKLLSPDYPQPNQAARTALLGAPVKYNIKIVK